MSCWRAWLAWRQPRCSSWSGASSSQIAHEPPPSLLTVSLLGALWSSSSAMTAIIDTLNQAYHVREGRAWWRVRLLAVGLTVVLTAFVLTAVG